MLQTLPYARLSAWYFFYFASLGAIAPYMGLYLQSIGFNALEIGELMAAITATRIIAPNIWAWVADKTGYKMRIVRWTSFIAGLCFIGMFWGRSYFYLVLILSSFSFFWNAALPQFEAVTLAHLGKNSHRYSHIRLWGSIGFIATVWGLGWFFQHQSLALFIPILLVLFLAIWLISLSVPECHVGHAKHLPQHISHVLRQPSVIALLCVGLLMQAGHGAYYTFYSIYLEAHGYSRSFIGGMWALGVLAEVILFIFMHRLLQHYGAKALLLSSLILASIRWVLIAFFIDNLAVLLFAQLLHAATFGSFHAASIHLIHHYFPGKLQARGQALYTSISFGLGSAIGTLSSGYMWEWSTTWTFLIASIVSVIAVFVAWIWIKTESFDVT